MTSRTPRVIATRLAFKGWNTLDIVTIEASDQSGDLVRHDREVIDHGAAAVVLTVDSRRRLAILVRQWRAPLIVAGADPYLLEACAGIIDPGETPEDAARREAEEEIGMTVGNLRKVGEVLPSAGTLTERMHLFIADVCSNERKQTGGGNAHEGESIEVVEVPLDDLFAMARRSEISDAKTLILVQHLMIEALST